MKVTHLTIDALALLASILDAARLFQRIEVAAISYRFGGSGDTILRSILLGKDREDPFGEPLRYRFGDRAVVR